MRNALLGSTLALVALFALQDTATAAPSEFQITPRVGLGDLRIDAFEGLEEGLAETDTYGLGVGVGFLTPIGVVVEAGIDTFGDYEIFDNLDSFSLEQKFVSVGYQFELGQGWRIVPRVGRTRWKLKSEEGRFFFFDFDPDGSREIRGYDYFWEASVSRRISRVVTLGVNYKQGNFEFGRTRTTAFVVTFGF